ncbi:dihydropyrimidinase [Miniphocaeibacter halophilus]|uniref:Dihydropyrimidinase n=1 Tax=Miniphocaeibacter halophilus TaxID=2931922 RepID=A0AC61MMK9_9FIRM|nr:dihydropyrimidinase [Miniphocaeibacter halophilus]QQK06952.1 dihydropyrimidinase [Miniphocaeibacter halophilus]
MFDTIIKNANIYTDGNNFEADIGIKDGIIAELAKKGTISGGHKIIDAKGKLVIPGLIDPHVHIHAPFGNNIDILDFYSASKLAAFGGVTSIIDFTNTVKGDSIVEVVKNRKNEMKNSAIDYSLHVKYVESNEKLLKEIPEIIEMGCPSFKMFMTYKKAGVMIDDIDILKVLETIKKNKAMAGFHAESNSISEFMEDKFSNEHLLGWENFPNYKPNICEYEAVERVISYAELTGARIYLFHITTAESVEIIRKAKERGVDVIAETCLHYLIFNKEKNQGEDGILYIMSPPLRTDKDIEALWKGINDGTLSIVSSDNCSFTRELKEINLHKSDDGTIIKDFRKVVNGVSGLEERLGILISEGVKKNRISFNKFVEITSTNPAKIFGMYPKKGTISIGADADIVILDPNRKKALTKENLHYNLDYSIYEDYVGEYLPVYTIRRGEILVENDEFKGKEGTGQFIKRKLIG